MSRGCGITFIIHIAVSIIRSIMTIVFYTPGVIAFKSDTNNPKLLPEEKWYSVNVLTCAAPNLREKPSNGMNSGDGNASVHVSREELQALHEKRMRKVLEIAANKENDVVILGAFGCGAFCNPPLIVAQAMKKCSTGISDVF